MEPINCIETVYWIFSRTSVLFIIKKTSKQRRSVINQVCV